MTTASLGQLVLDTAQGTENDKKGIPQPQANQIRDSLSARVDRKIEELRAQQRKAQDDSKAITVF